MLIVQVTQSYFSHGAVMKRARQETKSLLKAGHQVIVITDLRWISQLRYFKNDKIKPKIVEIRPFYIHKPFRVISSQLSFSFLSYITLKKISKSFSIDLIISYASTICYSIVRFAKKRKIPTAWVIQDLIRYRKETGNPYNWMETIILLHSDRFALSNISYPIPVSKYTKKLALMDGANPKNTFIKYNAIDTELFKPLRNIEKDIDVLYFGRLSIEKGVHILIDAVKLVENNIKVVIIGEGPLKDELRNTAIRTGKNIDFLGFIDHHKLPHYINRSKLVVVPSLSEFHASVPLEAMACEVPVIASRVAGMEDSIDHNIDGWLMENNDPLTLANLIGKILSDPNLLTKTGKVAYKKAQKFSELNFYEKISSFYETIASKFNS